MTDKNCGCHQDGYCLKGLPGTPCEVDGCVAHLDFNNIAPKSVI